MFASPRPSFLNPPVVEVVLSAQFEEIAALGVAQIGLLWERYRDEFPRTEDKAPLPAIIERFDRPATPKVGFTITSAPHPPRCWFINRTGNELIQVQNDRFIFNWRRSENNQPYPRYESVRTRFQELFPKFLTHLHDLGEMIVPNQCEVTYVNHIYPGDGWSEVGDLKNLFAFWSGDFPDGFLGTPEDVRIQMRHVIVDKDGKPSGRLMVDAEPRVSTRHDATLLRLSLTARGAPLEPSVEGIFRFFDLGREYVVRGFASLTTKHMHKIWRRTDV